MYIIKNKTKINITICNNLFNRFIGFMFKRNIIYGLCFPRCNSIHTFFMLKPIDVIMTDKNYNILYIYKNFKPNKIILPQKSIIKLNIKAPLCKGRRVISHHSFCADRAGRRDGGSEGDGRV